VAWTTTVVGPIENEIEQEIEGAWLAAWRLVLGLHACRPRGTDLHPLFLLQFAQC